MMAAAVCRVRARLLVSQTASCGQLVRQRVEDVGRRAVAVEIALAVDAAAVGNGRVSDPPPARLLARHPHYSIVTTILPMALRAPSRAIASPALASGKRSDTTGLMAPLA